MPGPLSAKTPEGKKAKSLDGNPIKPSGKSKPVDPDMPIDPAMPESKHDKHGKQDKGGKLAMPTLPGQGDDSAMPLEGDMPGGGDLTGNALILPKGGKSPHAKGKKESTGLPAGAGLDDPALGGLPPVDTKGGKPPHGKGKKDTKLPEDAGLEDAGLPVDLKPGKGGKPPHGRSKPADPASHGAGMDEGHLGGLAALPTNGSKEAKPPHGKAVDAASHGGKDVGAGLDGPALEQLQGARPILDTKGGKPPHGAKPSKKDAMKLPEGVMPDMLKAAGLPQGAGMPAGAAAEGAAGHHGSGSGSTHESSTHGAGSHGGATPLTGDKGEALGGELPAKGHGRGGEMPILP